MDPSCAKPGYLSFTSRLERECSARAARTLRKSDADAAVLPAVPRLCPRERTPLREQRAGRVNVDICPNCRGTFVDGIELRRVVGDDALALALSGLRGAPEEPMDCVACERPMYFDTVDGIELDHCVDCLGVWLDAGEVERLARRTDAIAKARAPKLDAVLRDVARGLEQIRR